MSTPTTPIKRRRKKIIPAPEPVSLVETADHAESPADVLSKLVPPPWYNTDYERRTLAGRTDVDYLRYAKSVKENVLITGPTGCGKTSCVYAYAAEDRIPLVTIACNGAVDPSTLWGRPTLQNGTAGHIESNLLTVAQYGGILLWDESNMAPARVMAVIRAALDKRRLITIPELGNKQIDLHPDVQMFTNINEGFGYEGTRPLSHADRNRYAIQLVFDYDAAIEARLVPVVPTLLKVAAQVRELVGKDILTPVSTNKLQEFQQHAIHMGVDAALMLFLNAFPEDEREPVRKAFEHFMNRIVQEVNDYIIAKEETNA